GRLQPSALRAGNVVRDEQSVLIGPRAPNEPLTVEIELLQARARLGVVKMSGRAHVVDGAADASDQSPQTFASKMQLRGADVEPAEVRPSQKTTVTLQWRGTAEMTPPYKVFVHVLDRDEKQV